MEKHISINSKQKIDEYIDRIKNGEKKESIIDGLPPSFVSEIEKVLADNNIQQIEKNLDEEIKIPPLYDGMDSETLDFMWTIREYVDPEKTKLEKERKKKVLELVRQKEKENSLKEEKILEDQETKEKIRLELGISEMEKPDFQEKDEFSDFRLKNGETDSGVFWNEYRNQIIKEMKDSGEFKWGKERIYFDIPINECENLRDIALKIASENKIPIAFKYLDDKKTIQIHKDGNETRFVMNFVSNEDARKFYGFLSKSENYKNISPDRKLDYKGIRIDRLAEYASGFREEREALERIMGSKENDDGLYEYTTLSGLKMTLSKKEFEIFKEKYDEIEKNIIDQRNSWNNIVENNEEDSFKNVFDLEILETTENLKRREILEDMLNETRPVSFVDKTKAPFKDFRENDESQWKFVSNDEIENYLKSKLFFDTRNIDLNKVSKSFPIDNDLSKTTKIPLDLVVYASGFKDWTGRNNNFDKTFQSKYSKYGESSEMSSLNIIKHYANLQSEIPPVGQMRMFVQPNGKVFFDNGPGDSHRIAAAILRGDETINANNIIVYKLEENYL
jgi:hypothetical protein